MRLVLTVLGALALPSAAQERAPQGEAALPRHALETRALTEPDAVLAALPAELASARQRGDAHEVALLELARANACRVVADWNCQRDAGAAARASAAQVRDPVLEVRGLIAESRGAIALQDFSHGERLLGEAELKLRAHPEPSLMGDVMLAYSSLSFLLGKHVISAEYAERGLHALGQGGDLGMRIRLLRNQARAQAQLGDVVSAQSTLRLALDAAARLVDPKLSAELLLERARLARRSGDISTQNQSGLEVLRLAEQLENSQLAGLGHEVLGLAATDEGDDRVALDELRAAHESFRSLDLDRDQLRVLRELLRVAIHARQPPADVNTLALELLVLDQKLRDGDRAAASADFDARVKYAEREVELTRLQDEALLARERERALDESNRLSRAITALVAVVLLILGAFFLAQRRLNLRLQRALAEQRRSEEALALNQERLRAVTDNMPALIAHVDLQERYDFANAYYQTVFGIDPAGMIGKTVREVRGEAVYREVEPHIRAALRGETVSFDAYSEVRGRHYHSHSNYVPDLGPDGKVRGLFALTFDITTQKLAELELSRLARFDSLTAVANRRQFDERLGMALARSRRQRTAVTLLVLDIDHFKRINDTLGHPVGDEVIREFARRLCGCVREGDLVARIGGDEFAVLVEDATTPEVAETIARKLATALDREFDTAEGAIAVRSSIGIAFSVSPGGAEALLAMADEALYAAKAAGRNTWRLVRDDMESAPQR